MKTSIKELPGEIKKAVQNSNLKHIALIMDGNRRWAKIKGLPSIAGHNEGVNALKKTVQAALDFGIKYITVYAFSTENWGRKQEEVDFLMFLLKETIKNQTKELHGKGARVRIIGDREPLNAELLKVIDHAESLTVQNKNINLQIAINYGSRKEITEAARKIAVEVQEGRLNTDHITEETLCKYLYTSDIPDPDLLVRTGGENRISNYLLWQIAYTEIYSTKAYWPEFGEEELAKAVLEFANRERRFGRDSR